MGEPFESYSPDMVWEFNDSYTVSINLIKPVRNSARDQPPLSYTLGRGVRVDLSEETIHRFLFRPKFERPGTIDEFEYSMKIVSLQKKVATLRSKVYTLVESHALVIPLIIPSIKQSLPTPPSLIFYLFAGDDEAQIIRASKGWDPIKQSDILGEFEWSMKQETIEFIFKFKINVSENANEIWVPSLVKAPKFSDFLLLETDPRTKILIMDFIDWGKGVRHPLVPWFDHIFS
ncbi:hypothetical protein FXO38_19460 [Capsicum annuum]|nr:hypothetical protein FXO38_19460 [Capsicum annuum]